MFNSCFKRIFFGFIALFVLVGLYLLITNPPTNLTGSKHPIPDLPHFILPPPVFEETPLPSNYNLSSNLKSDSSVVDSLK